jgi:exonuclease VII large subunit
MTEKLDAEEQHGCRECSNSDYHETDCKLNASWTTELVSAVLDSERKDFGRMAQATAESQPCEDPTQFLQRSFAVVENSNHSIRLIDRNDARQAISIKWRDLPVLLELITLMLKDDRPVGPPEKS